MLRRHNCIDLTLTFDELFDIIDNNTDPDRDFLAEIAMRLGIYKALLVERAGTDDIWKCIAYAQFEMLKEELDK